MNDSNKDEENSLLFKCMNFLSFAVIASFFLLIVLNYDNIKDEYRFKICFLLGFLAAALIKLRKYL